MHFTILRVLWIFNVWTSQKEALTLLLKFRILQSNVWRRLPRSRKDTLCRHLDQSDPCPFPDSIQAHICGQQKSYTENSARPVFFQWDNPDRGETTIGEKRLFIRIWFNCKLLAYISQLIPLVWCKQSSQTPPPRMTPLMSIDKPCSSTVALYLHEFACSWQLHSATKIVQVTFHTQYLASFSVSFKSLGLTYALDFNTRFIVLISLYHHKPADF